MRKTYETPALLFIYTLFMHILIYCRYINTVDKQMEDLENSFNAVSNGESTTVLLSCE